MGIQKYTRKSGGDRNKEDSVRAARGHREESAIRTHKNPQISIPTHKNLQKIAGIQKYTRKSGGGQREGSAKKKLSLNSRWSINSLVMPRRGIRGGAECGGFLCPNVGIYRCYTSLRRAIM